ncbi:MAG: hypothetical protein HW413_114 [Thermoleophilia bacterium]|nr:hypothetical protein [Thermoleophilia bacterium]
MSSELERLLREAREALPGPDEDATERARMRALAAIRRRRPRARVVALLGATLVAAVALGVSLGTLVAPSGTAAREPSGLGFLPEPGWFSLQSPPTAVEGQPVVAVAANVPFAQDDVVDGLVDPSGLPYSTLLTLPPRGAVIVGVMTKVNDQPHFAGLFPDYEEAELPLRLRNAVPYVQWGAQVRPDQPLANYQLRARIGNYNVDLTFYFGTPTPSSRLLAEAQRQLDGLVVASTKPRDHEAVCRHRSNGAVLDRRTRRHLRSRGKGLLRHSRERDGMEAAPVRGCQHRRFGGSQEHPGVARQLPGVDHRGKALFIDNARLGMGGLACAQLRNTGAEDHGLHEDHGTHPSHRKRAPRWGGGAVWRSCRLLGSISRPGEDSSDARVLGEIATCPWFPENAGCREDSAACSPNPRRKAARLRGCCRVRKGAALHRSRLRTGVMVRNLIVLVVSGVAAVALFVQPAAPAQPVASRIIDLSFSCSVRLWAGARVIEVSAVSGFRDPENRPRWKWLAGAGIGTRDGGLGGVSAGAPPPLPDPGATAQTRWLSINPQLCEPTTARTALSAKDLSGGPASQLRGGAHVGSDAYECTTRSGIIVRIRAVFRTATTLRVQRLFGQKWLTTATAAVIREAQLAVRTQSGRPLAYAEVFESGKARLFASRSCVPD